MRTVDRDLGEETVHLCWRIVGALGMKCMGHSLDRKDRGTRSYTRWFHKLDAILVHVGALDQLQGLNGMAQGCARKSLAGLMIGGIAETQEVIDYCAARHIKADIELIRPEDINRAYERVVTKNVRDRFVIDMASLKAPA